MNKVVEIWAVFDRPNEHPNSYAARRFLNNTPTDDFILSHSIEEVEQALTDKGLIEVKFESENPEVTQVWIRGGRLN